LFTNWHNKLSGKEKAGEISPAFFISCRALWTGRQGLMAQVQIVNQPGDIGDIGFRVTAAVDISLVRAA